MRRIYFISGPCGCGKSTFTDVYARHLVREGHRTVYVIHGDDFYDGFVETEDKPDFFTEDGQPSDQVLWEDILRFNWDCIIATADRALQQVKWATLEEILEMIDDGRFIPYEKSQIELLFFRRNHRSSHTRNDWTRPLE